LQKYIYIRRHVLKGNSLPVPKKPNFTYKLYPQNEKKGYLYALLFVRLLVFEILLYVKNLWSSIAQTTAGERTLKAARTRLEDLK